MKFPVFAAILRRLKPNSAVKKVSAKQVSGLTLYDKIEEIVSIANSRNNSYEAVTMFYDLTKVQRQVTLVALVEHHMVDALELILKTGFDVNFLVRGQSLLHFAIKSKNLKIVSLLLKYKADTECKNKHGEAALSYAVRKGNDIIVRYLLNYRAKLPIHKQNDLTPSAIIHNDIETETMLVKQHPS